MTTGPNRAVSPLRADGGDGSRGRRFRPGGARIASRRDSDRYLDQGDGQIIAVLGPTNTGKTHYAVERMLAHPSGVIGLPLRLLAREIYDKLKEAKGAHRVRLQTGEEVIGPSDAPWVAATVEAMPMKRRFSFFAVDEIQLAADFERGHVFTDRLLRGRGDEETIFLGSDVVRPLLRRLVPEASIVERPRFSTLSWAGPCRLNRMPRRSAVVAFTASDVYRLAEVMRRQKGGAAVVMGALSPRTRNAQVAMYQEGEVEHLVATDAIGMGLNMDLAHVAFASLKKFDGRERRRLSAQEAAQIAGRAGRHVRDGTFGVTSAVGEVDDGLIEAVEQHRFEPLRRLRWRNADLAFASIEELQASLAVDPPDPCLIKVRDGIDDRALALLAKNEVARKRATGEEAVRRLWRVCQIPDFRKTLSERHLRFLSTVFEHLSDRGCLPDDWVADRIAALDRADGDIETLTERLAHVRTWTYVSHRRDWLKDPEHWRAEARAVEDKLSDALHDRLTQRFVDKRTSVLLKSMREKDGLAAFVDPDGSVVVEGCALGRLEGLGYDLDQGGGPIERKVVAAAARRAIGPALAARARALAAEEDDAFALDGATLLWRGAPVARLVKGDREHWPRLRPIVADELDGAPKKAAAARLERWFEQWRAARLGCLDALEAASRSVDLTSAGRGLAYAVLEGGGAAPTGVAAPGQLSQSDRRILGRIGLRFGVRWLYAKPLLRPEAIAARLLCAALFEGRTFAIDPEAGALRGVAATPERLRALGFASFGALALRVDLVEKIAAQLRAAARAEGAFAPPEEAAAAAGLERAELVKVARALGYRATGAGDELRLRRRGRGDQAAPRRQAPRPSGEGGAFAALAQWSAAAREESADGAQRARRNERKKRAAQRRRARAASAVRPLVAGGVDVAEPAAAPSIVAAEARSTPPAEMLEAAPPQPIAADEPPLATLDRGRDAREKRTVAIVEVASDADALRLDKWLWRARMFKSRTLAAMFVRKRRARINQSSTEKPHALLREGDILTLAMRDRVRVLKVLKLGTRRGPAAEARLLYEEVG